MNPQQTALQLRSLLRTVTWGVGDDDPVFGSNNVLVAAGQPADDFHPPGYPFVLILIGGGRPDPLYPDLIEQTFEVFTGAKVAGDPHGQHAITGGSTPGLGNSAGRGITEIAVKVRAAVGQLTGADGAPVVVTDTAIDTPRALARGTHFVVDSHTLTTWCTSDLYYAAPQQLNHDGADWTWAGAHCSARFDHLQYRLVSKSGASPSSTPADGTTVYTGSTASYTGAATAGLTYTVFADYDARGGGAVEGSSDPEVGSYRVVTA